MRGEGGQGGGGRGAPEAGSDAASGSGGSALAASGGVAVGGAAAWASTRPARPPGVRHGNLADVLGLVHLEGPLSRASLTRRTGLNRSTVGDLVTTLGEAGLVVEHDPRPSRRVGRPSPLVAASPRVAVVAANPEVDALTMAVFGLGRRLRARARLAYDAPPTPAKTARLVASQIDAWRADGTLRGVRVVGVGLAVPGLVRAADGLVSTAPHLGWSGANLGALVAEATGLPAVVGNDANLGLVAEHRFGAARGARDVVYLNGGDGGIGGAIIAAGTLIGGSDGYAGEFGHTRVASGAALEDEVSRIRLLHTLGVRALEDSALTAALGRAAPGEAPAVEVARQRGVLTGVLADIVSTFSPSIVVLGGFLTDVAPRDLDGYARRVCAEARPTVGRSLVVRLAELVENRLLYGAAEAAFDDQVLAAEVLERWCADL